jgi:hypothetical protein
MTKTHAHEVRDAIFFPRNFVILMSMQPFHLSQHGRLILLRSPLEYEEHHPFALLRTAVEKDAQLEQQWFRGP